MTAMEIIQKRTDMSEEDAEFYIEMAEDKIKSYLGLASDADMTPYVYPIADIAVLCYQKDKSSLAIGASFGLSSESFQEGSVSHKITSMNGAMVYSTYDNAILAVLEAIGNTGREYEVVFL